MSAIVSVGYQLVFLVFLAVFLCALVGFLVFYGLEKTATVTPLASPSPNRGVASTPRNRLTPAASIILPAKLFSPQNRTIVRTLATSPIRYSVLL